MSSEGSKRVTGVVFDERLESHFSLWNKEYTERPERTRKSVQRCKEYGLLDRCKRIPVREATDEEIRNCHSQSHLDLLCQTKSMTEDELKDMSQKYDFIYFHQKSYENAKLALGATVDLVEEIVTEKIHNGMAIVRPPGHHAMEEEFCGYCYFNNVALAAKLMIEKHNLNRILIVDWDVHHGQGSQFFFYDDPRVLYISIHRYEHGKEWPSLRESDYDYIGLGAGKGYNINIPLNEIDCGNSEYLSIFFNLLLPVFYEFDPELILVSAGFDSAIGCPEGEMAVTPACFAHFVNLLTPLATGKLALILEGGYNMKSLSESVALSLRALLDDPTPAIGPIAAPKQSVIESVLNALKVLWPCWKSLQFQDIVEAGAVSQTELAFPAVLQVPPCPGVTFYTLENRPKRFPLIQACCDEGVLEKIDDLDRYIDHLIQTTSLACAQHRLSLAYDQTSDIAEDCYSTLCANIKSKGLWSKCLPLYGDSGQNSSQTCTQDAVNSLLSKKAEAGIVAISSSSLSSSMASILQQNANNQQFNRILVVEFSSHLSSASPNLSHPSVLHVEVNLSNHLEKDVCHDVCDNGNSTDSRQNVKIVFEEGIRKDGDVLAAFHHLVLPISYEFNPDFVILLLNDTSKLHDTDGVSTTLMCHVSQYLRGLSQGKLLVVVACQDSVLEDDSGGKVMDRFDDVVQCASVLLGERCRHLPFCLPSKGAVAKIKAILESLKPYWKVIQFKEKIPKLQV